MTAQFCLHDALPICMSGSAPTPEECYSFFSSPVSRRLLYLPERKPRWQPPIKRSALSPLPPRNAQTPNSTRALSTPSLPPVEELYSSSQALCALTTPTTDCARLCTRTFHVPRLPDPQQTCLFFLLVSRRRSFYLPERQQRRQPPLTHPQRTQRVQEALGCRSHT